GRHGRDGVRAHHAGRQARSRGRGQGELLRHPSMDGQDALPDDDGQILDAIGKWLDRDVRRHVMKLEHDDIYPAEMVEQMKALGLFGATIAPEYGGLGLSASTYARIVATTSEVWMSLTGIFNSHL